MKRRGRERESLVDLMMKPRGLSVKGRAKRLSRGRPQREQSAVALSLVRLLGSPGEGEGRREREGKEGKDKGEGKGERKGREGVRDRGDNEGKGGREVGRMGEEM